MIDLLITNGTVIDGTGSAPRRADVAVADGHIVEVAPVIDAAGAARTIDASDRIVTPGFIDVHTHYDGQVTWDGALEPSSPHGVTTVMIGNCGVGFAPVRPDRREQLIELMEGVEDIPGAALSEGITWGWESFGDYLDALDDRQWAIDVGTQLPHGALRTYVRGDQPVNDPATGDEIAAMSRLAREAMEAGAFGFSTSRTLGHKALDGTPVPGTYAAGPELEALAAAVAAGGGRVFEIAPSGLARSDDDDIVAGEMAWIGRLAEQTGLTTTFICLQMHHRPDRWRSEMEQAAHWRGRGANVVPLVAGRPFAALWGWDVRHPFMCRPSYQAIAHLPLPERLAELRNPATRAAILAEDDVYGDDAERRQMRYLTTILPECFLLSGVPDYEQPFSERMGDRADAAGHSLLTEAYDRLISADDALLFYPLYNYVTGDHTVLHEQLLDPAAVVGLNDGGAHCAFICDASIPTYFLSHWARDRSRGPRLDLGEAVRRLTSQPADLYGLADRGRIAPGLRADLNVIDAATIDLATPRAVRDLPAGGTRLLQDATGYDATIVHGVITRTNGVDTGARPGRLLRS